jgi:hypothetical protein
VYPSDRKNKARREPLSQLPANVGHLANIGNTATIDPFEKLRGSELCGAKLITKDIYQLGIAQIKKILPCRRHVNTSFLYT